MKLSMEAPKMPESSPERAEILAEIKRGAEMARDGRTAWTDVLLEFFPEIGANDIEPEEERADDRSYNANVSKAALLSKIDQLSELEVQLVQLEKRLPEAS